MVSRSLSRYKAFGRYQINQREYVHRVAQLRIREHREQMAKDKSDAEYIEPVEEVEKP